MRFVMHIPLPVERFNQATPRTRPAASNARKM